MIPKGLEPRSFFVGETWPESGTYVTVEWRGDNSWAVCYKNNCANRKGVLSYERLPSSRTAAWLRSHRFTLEEAAKIARKVLKAESKKVAEWMAWRDAKWAEEEARAGENVGEQNR